MEQQELETYTQSETTATAEKNPTSQCGDSNHLDCLISEFDEVEELNTRNNLIHSGSLISKEAFRSIVFGGSEIAKAYKPQYKSLKMLSEENSQAINAIDTLYDCILDIPQLHWIISPGNKWVQRGFALGCFFVPFGFSLYQDMQTPKMNIKEHQKVNLYSFEEKQHD